MSVLMASLAEHRRDLRLPGRQVAAHVGVDRGTLSRWERGRYSPRWPHVLAYAAAVSRRVVVWRDGVVAPGEDVPGCLAGIRERAGLSKDELACRMRVARRVVRYAERDRGHTLPTIEAYLAALGAELRHLPLEAS